MKPPGVQGGTGKPVTFIQVELSAAQDLNQISPAPLPGVRRLIAPLPDAQRL